MVQFTWEHVHLRSPNPEETAVWYRDKLGAEVIRTKQADGSNRIDLTLAGQFADRLVLLDRGEVVLDGPSHEVVRSEELASRYAMNLRVIDVDGADVVVPVRR